MKQGLNNIAIVAVCLTIAYVCVTLRDCGEVGQSTDLVVIPRDTAFLPVTYREYRPKSTPFEQASKPVSKLPLGVKEKDVTRVITIRTVATGKKLEIIETKSGEVHVPKGTDSLDVAVINYLPPFLQFGLYADIGITLTANRRLNPAVSISFCKFADKVYAPVVTADLRSIGVGIGYQLYHDFTITPLFMWNYLDTQKTIKLQVSYQL